jgi:hypothetical protein
MCYECQTIDKTILHYRQIERLTTDQSTLDSIHILIARLEADKQHVRFECGTESRFEN